MLVHHIADPQEISFPPVIVVDSLPYHPLSWIWTHRFECALNSLATIELKLLFSFNRKAMLACGPQCHGLLDRGLDDTCCIRSEVTDLTPHLPHPPSPLRSCHGFWCLFSSCKDAECCGLDKHFRLRTLSLCCIAFYTVEFGAGGLVWRTWKMCTAASWCFSLSHITLDCYLPSGLFLSHF